MSVHITHHIIYGWKVSDKVRDRIIAQVMSDLNIDEYDATDELYNGIEHNGVKLVLSDDGMDGEFNVFGIPIEQTDECEGFDKLHSFSGDTIEELAGKLVDAGVVEKYNPEANIGLHVFTRYA